VFTNIERSVDCVVDYWLSKVYFQCEKCSLSIRPANSTQLDRRVESGGVNCIVDLPGVPGVGGGQFSVIAKQYSRTADICNTQNVAYIKFLFVLCSFVCLGGQFNERMLLWQPFER